LRREKPPRGNISKEECNALKNLRSNADLVILKDDKFGTAVIINCEDYKVNYIEDLTFSGSYR
jgi:hypothetical protein